VLVSSPAIHRERPHGSRNHRGFPPRSPRRPAAVAVKLLHNSRGDGEEFVNEVVVRFDLKLN
jgi:hypothetical protein